MNVKQVMPFIGQVVNLSHPRHYGFMERVLGRAQSFVNQIGENCPAALKSLFQRLHMAVVGEDDAYKTHQGSDYTPRIKEADEARDTTLSGLRGMLEALQKIGTDEQKAAAGKVLAQMDLYRLKPTDGYEEEGVKLAQFCDDCGTNVQLELALTKCGLRELVATLKTQNETCRGLVNMRNEERSYIDGQAMQKARKVSDEAYADFVMMLNALAVTTASDGYSQYDNVIGYINADIDYFKQWVLRKYGGTAAEPEGGAEEADDEDIPAIRP